MPLCRSRQCLTDCQVGGADRGQKLMTHGRIKPLACLRRNRRLREFPSGGESVPQQTLVLMKGGRQPFGGR